MPGFITNAVEFGITCKAKNLILESANLLPVTLQSYSFSQESMALTNSTNPVQATLSAMMLIVDACLPPNIKYPVKCLALAAQLIVCASASGTASAFSAATTVASARQIIKEML